MTYEEWSPSLEGTASSGGTFNSEGTIDNIDNIDIGVFSALEEDLSQYAPSGETYGSGPGYAASPETSYHHQSVSTSPVGATNGPYDYTVNSFLEEDLSHPAPSDDTYGSPDDHFQFRLNGSPSYTAPPETYYNFQSVSASPTGLPDVPYNHVEVVDRASVNALIQEVQDVRSSVSNGGSFASEQFGQSVPTAPAVTAHLAPYGYWQGTGENYNDLYPPTGHGTPDLSHEHSLVTTAARPRTPSSSQGTGRYSCSHCSKIFDKSNDCKRHKEIHTDGPQFTCRCSYQTKRKDNYKRHVGACKRFGSNTSYACKCGLLDSKQQAHLQHLKKCTFGHHGTAGRPAGGRTPPMSINGSDYRDNTLRARSRSAYKGRN